MATNAPDVLEWLADQWEATIPSAECSGIVNDSGDRGKTSKHWSRQDNPSGSWAVTHSKDKKGPSNMSAAIDMTMHDDSDMFAVHKRFKALFNDRDTDPRAAYVDCFNGWDGNGSPGRYDLPAGTVSTTDDSHKWHEHVESFYLYMGTDKESWKAARAILSVVKGETAQEWLDSEEGGTVSQQDVLDALASKEGQKLLGQAVLGYDPGKNADGTYPKGSIKNLDAENAVNNPTVGLAWAAGERSQTAVDLGYQIRGKCDAILTGLDTVLSMIDADDDDDQAAIAQVRADIAALSADVGQIPAETVALLGDPETPDEVVADALRTMLGDRLPAVLARLQE